MKDVPIHLLKAFVVFNESVSIREAANSLGITQPALSKQLKSLEAFAPQPIFMFSGRRKVLTPFGQDLHLQLKARIGNLQAVFDEVSNTHSKPAEAKIRISGRRGVLDRISERITFSGKIIFIETTSGQVAQDLLERKTDIGVTYKFPETHELIAKPLLKERFQIVVPKSLKLSQRSFSKDLLSELQRFPFIGYRFEDEVLEKICSGFSKREWNFRTIRATANYTSIAKMVDAGLGWAAIPSYLEVDSRRTWTVPVPQSAIPIREFSLIYRAGYSSVPWFKNLVSEIKGCFTE